jgi:hypothetical protein
MTIPGINYKEDFEELMKWKRIMDKNIDQTIRILEEDMMEHYLIKYIIFVIYQNITNVI